MGTRELGQGPGPPGPFDMNNNKSLVFSTVCSNTGGWLGSIPALPPSLAPPPPPPPPRFLLLSLQGSVSGTRLGPMTRAGIPLGHLATSAQPRARRLCMPDLRPLPGTQWEDARMSKRGFWPQVWLYPSFLARSFSGAECRRESRRESWREGGREGTRQVRWVG